LFEAICRLPEYYLTRTEIAILEENASEIAAQMGRHCRLIEFGSGASTKVRILLEALDDPAAYVPVDISRERLRDAAASLAEDFPSLSVVAVCADYTRPFPLPPLPGPNGRRVGFFPGSTIGNFEPDAAVAFLANYARVLGPGGEMLIGVDVKKDPAIIEAAYNDRAGVTARFNLTSFSGSTASSTAISTSIASSMLPSTTRPRVGSKSTYAVSPIRKRGLPASQSSSARAS